MSLREKVARTLAGPWGDWPDYSPAQRELWLDAADRILAIPEIAEALALYARDGGAPTIAAALAERSATQDNSPTDKSRKEPSD